MTHQMNLIVWDPVNKVEHFIRNATFETAAPDLAFIAPTPSVPEIKKVDAEIFFRLQAMSDDLLHPGADAAYATKSDSIAPDDVAVIQEMNVSGFHIVTLKAKDTTGLLAWLKQHHYPFDKSAKSWSQKYVDKGWYLTAFKVQADHSEAETGTVRMSFKTDKPFNPYFVPKNNAPAGGGLGLDLYFVSSAEYVGKIGGKEKWMDPLITFPVDKLRSAFSDDLKLQDKALPQNLVASYYKDESFPRANVDDIYFELKEAAWVRPATVCAIVGSIVALVFLYVFVIMKQLERRKTLA